ncbi:serine hydrolase domain-containing protein [Paenibacillus graminis]|uniref:serine hydrolase domain-containing protein n=2 Tax=Paenibacillus graminis TaxID=189425 RepID=UPI0030C99615
MMKLKSVLIVSVILWMGTFGTVSAAQAAGTDDALTQEQLEETLTPLLNKIMEADHIPGTAVVVTEGERIVFSKGYGYADVGKQLPVDPGHTVMRVGSLTKSMTAAAVMQLKEQGKVAMDQDINTYLTNFKVPLYHSLPITLHHLLTHTAGLDEGVYHLAAPSADKAVPAETFLQQYLATQPPVREPGTEYAYSNPGAGLAGFLIEQVTGSTLEAYMQRSLFGPLQMPSASLIHQDSDPDMAKSYQYEKGSFQEIPYSYPNLPGAGALSVIPDELAHYMIALLNEGSYQGQHILKQATVEEMQARQFTEHPGVEGVGYGLFRNRTGNGILTLSHTGDIDGFAAKMQLIPEHKLGILVVSNAESPGKPLRDQVTDAIVRLLPAPQIQDPAVAAPSSPDLEQYARTYTMGLGPQHGWGKWFRWLGGKNFEVQNAGETLRITGVFPEGTGSEESKTYIPVREGLFRDKESGELISFHQQAGVWKLTFIQGVTIEEKPAFLQQPSTLLAIYAGIGLAWPVMVLIEVIRSLLRLIRRKKQQGLGHAAFIAVIFSIYLIGQLLYGNSQVIFGYPSWYAWGFSSLPFLAAAAAIHLGIQTVKHQQQNTDEKRRVRYGRYLLVVMSLGYTFFLYYWNMLSVHFS